MPSWIRSPSGLVVATLLIGFGGGALFALRVPRSSENGAIEQATLPAQALTSTLVPGSDSPSIAGGSTDLPGREVYVTHCASCHGLRGEGQPDWKIPLEDGSLPAPPQDHTGHTWHHADAELLRIISDGGVIYMPESRMPGFSAVLDDAEMRSVLAYIKTMWGSRELAFQEEVSKNWEDAVGAED